MVRKLKVKNKKATKRVLEAVWNQHHGVVKPKAGDYVHDPATGCSGIWKGNRWYIYAPKVRNKELS